MLREINDIAINGGQFPDGTVLTDIISLPFNILYGNNGSGKTTVSRHFIEHNADLYGGKAFVFNDKFITDNVALQQVGVQAIAMLGKQEIADDNARNNLRKAIDGYDKEITTANQQIENAKTEIASIGATIINSLDNSNDGYAKRRSRSAGNIKLTATYKVSSEYGLKEIIDKIIPIRTTTDNQANVRVKVEELIDKLAPFRNKEQYPITWFKPQLNLQAKIDHADALLRKTIERPLTPHGEMIISSLTNVDDIQKKIIEDKAEICPLCHQPISADHLNKLKEAINALLNQEADDFKNEINDCIASLIVPEMDLGVVEKVSLQKVTSGMVNTEFYNLQCRIDAVKARLNDKLVHLYDVVEPLDDKEAILNPFEDILNAIESDVAEYNKACNEFKSNKASFESSNLLLTYLENKSDFDKYIEYKELIKNATNHINDCKLNQASAQQELQKLADAGCQDKTQAMNFINECLAMVFFDSMHLQLNVEQNQYVIKVRGKDVKPEMLSTGEINALAMAYFFATLFAGKSEKEKYNDEMLVVIDDPISSFDHFNRTGMIVMMCGQLEKILTGNRNSKILVMTHDFRTLKALIDNRYKILSAPYHKHKDAEGKNDNFYSNEKLSYCILDNHSIKKSTKIDSTEYSSLLNRICIYAMSDNEESMENESLVIGNIMRRVTEQYTLFNCHKNIGEAFKQFGYSERDYATRELFKNLPAKMYMNEESHNAEATLDTIRSYTDKRMLARAIIYYILKTNYRHLTAQLGDEMYRTLLRFFHCLEGKPYMPDCEVIFNRNNA